MTDAGPYYAEELAELIRRIQHNVSASRALAIALTHLETAEMWLEKA